jgi:hypothetical protein
LREQRKELEQEQESLKCMILDLNEIWLQIIIDNGEDCKKTLTAKYEALSEKAKSLSKALSIRQEKGAHLGKIAAFWSLMVEEEKGENKRRDMRGITINKKALSCGSELLLQGLISLQSKTSNSTQASSED